MRTFLYLIACMPPVRARGLMPLVCLVAVYMALSRTGTEPFGFAPFVLANVTFYLAAIAINLPGTSWRLANIGSPVAKMLLWLLILAVPASMLVVNEPLYCQRLYSCSAFVLATALFIGIRFHWKFLTVVPWVGSGFTTGRINAARIVILGLFMEILLNETAIRFATQTEWISIRAILPLLISYLVWITILATHPNAEETDDG